MYVALFAAYVAERPEIPCPQGDDPRNYQVCDSTAKTTVIRYLAFDRTPFGVPKRYVVRHNAYVGMTVRKNLKFFYFIFTRF
jgi:hypothetical protein